MPGPLIAQKFASKLIKKEKVANHTHSFYFERPAQFDFLPGQFMRLTVEIKIPDEKSNYRLFSIASSPSEKDFLMITVRTNQSAFKETLLTADIGSKVQIAAPYGMFILKTEEINPHILLAGGIGITPFRSMIRYAADLKLTIPITLFTSFSLVEDRIFQPELNSIVENNSWFKLIETITQPDKSKLAWHGYTGRIDRGLIQKNITGISTAVFYIAGPPAMVEDINNVLKSIGIPENQIRSEKFTGY